MIAAELRIVGSFALNPVRDSDRVATAPRIVASSALSQVKDFGLIVEALRIAGSSAPNPVRHSALTAAVERIVASSALSQVKDFVRTAGAPRIAGSFAPNPVRDSALIAAVERIVASSAPIRGLKSDRLACLIKKTGHRVAIGKNVASANPAAEAETLQEQRGVVIPGGSNASGLNPAVRSFAILRKPGPKDPNGGPSTAATVNNPARQNHSVAAKTNPASIVPAEKKLRADSAVKRGADDLMKNGPAPRNVASLHPVQEDINAASQEPSAPNPEACVPAAAAAPTESRGVVANLAPRSS